MSSLLLILYINIIKKDTLILDISSPKNPDALNHKFLDNLFIKIKKKPLSNLRMTI